LLPLSAVSLLTSPGQTPQQAVATKRQLGCRSPKMTMIRQLAIISLSLLGGPRLHAAEKPPAFTRVKPGATLQSTAVTEASGLAASPTAADSLWLINDSGSPPVLHLAGTDGSERGTVTLRDIRNTDWEDLASFSLGGKPYLLVADTGDNTSTRPECLLHIVAEPAPPAAGKKLDETVSPAWTIRFRYEDGPRDCESVAVDEKAGKILLISKRTTPPVIYELPLKPDGKDLVTAKKIGTIPTPFPAGNPPIPFAAQPTGLDLSADGKFAVVVTYLGSFVFPKAADESWPAAFAKAPIALEPHLLRQAESVAFSRDGTLVHAVSEGARSPLVTYRLQR
jgi:hypothetical protein